ncbi:MAG: response regulator [Spirochaetes bacterium]|nr:response regulator [Spirochaetota bacterium]
MDDISVLVIDDEKILRKTLRHYLEDEGFSVVVASNGTEALALLPETAADVAIVDMKLPDMDGETVILRARELRPDLQFIVHTGDGNYILSGELARAGLQERHVIHKPVLDMAVIADLVRELAGVKRQ